jgi:hypothetical protein
MMRKENDQWRKIFSLQPYHPAYAQSCLVSEAKQGQAWLVFGWETNIQKKLLRNSLETRGECHQSSNGVTHAKPVKNNQSQED